jgi:TorA maturation chaperone TorD
VELLRRFLSEHLLVFGPGLLRSIQMKARSKYFKALARLGQTVLLSLGIMVDAKPAVVLNKSVFQGDGA